MNEYETASTDDYEIISDKEDKSETKGETHIFDAAPHY